jgi:hypothetical protein
MPYVETESPPILRAFFKQEKRTAYRPIQGSEIVIAPKRRIDASSTAELLGSVIRRKQVVAAAAYLRHDPDILDKLLNFDSIPADFVSLDIAMPYFEAKSLPTLAAFSKQEKRAAYRPIGEPAVTVSNRRIDASSTAELLGGVIRRKQLVTAAAYLPDALDKPLSFDSISADFFPLDIAIPHAKKTPPHIGSLFSRSRREAPLSVSIAAFAPAQQQGFYFSCPLTGSGTAKIKITGKGRPHERLSGLDDFLSFDSIPADFMPLDRAIPYREGCLLWR